MEQHINPHDDLLAIASYHARDTQLRCDDVASMLFPTGHIIPSDELISNVSAALRQLINAVLNAVAPQLLEDKATTSSCWQLLSRSGFLREPPMIDFMLARHAEQHLSMNVMKASAVAMSDQLPAVLLDNANLHIADAAQTVLAAGGMRGSTGRSLQHELSPELLHQTVWRVVAALQMVSGSRDTEVVERAKHLLSIHDESKIARVAARKIVHLLGKGYVTEFGSAEVAGIDLYTSALAVDTGLDHDHLLRLIDTHSSTPFATLLKTRNTPRDEAMAAIILLKGFDFSPREIGIIEDGYAGLSVETARAAIDIWAIERSVYLTFPAQSGRTVS